MEINAYTFLTALRAVSRFAAERDEARPILTSVHIFSTNEGFCMEASNGHAACRVFIDAEADRLLDAVLPHHFVYKLTNGFEVLKSDRATASLKLTCSWMEFSAEFGNEAIKVENLGGKYYDLDPAFEVGEAEEFALTTLINPEYLVKVGEAASLLADSKRKFCRIVASRQNASKLFMSVDMSTGKFANISKPAEFVIYGLSERLKL